jgi:hypothetical protein
MKILRVGALLAPALLACGKVGVPPPDTRPTVVELPAMPNRDLDLLFVIDDSPSMADKQQNLVANFPSFLGRLQEAPGGLPNLHVGVVTTDMGTKASGSPTPAPAVGTPGNGGCAQTGKGGALQIGTAMVTGRFLRDIEAPGGGRSRNYMGTLAEAFSAMASAGAGGCGFEQPLAAMRAALDNHPMNAGFLRPEAVLGIVLLADEDDCSIKSTALLGPEGPALGPLQSFRCTRFGVTCASGGATPDAMNTMGTKGQCSPAVGSEMLDDVAPYRDFINGLKRDQKRIAVTGILGPVEPVEVELRPPPAGGAPILTLAHSCTYMSPDGNTQVADPPVRLQSFLEGFEQRSARTPICQRDLSGGLVQLADLFRRAIGSPCVEQPLADVEPRRAGLQPDCLVEDLVGADAIEIDACEERPMARPCWRLEADATGCKGFMNLKLVIQRDTVADPRTITRMRCAVEG